MKKFLEVFGCIALVLFIGVFALFSCSSDDDANPKPVASIEENEVIEYEAVNVETLFKSLESNALTAEENYSYKYVELKGVLGTIDSDGSYICVESNDDNFFLESVQCYFNGDEELLEKAKTLTKGAPITVRGQITEVGEIMGYSLDLTEIL